MDILKLIISLLFITLLSCSPTKKLQKSLSPQIEKSPVFSKSFTGFALLDPENGEFIYEHQSDKYFTPASNTKIFTLYACLQILEEKPAVLRYEEQSDYVIFWGTGNPTLLHPTFKNDTTTIKFLKNCPKKIFFSARNFKEERFGPGWAWDDYPYYFQPEKSPLPIYGNVVKFEQDTFNSPLLIEPDYFKSKTTAYLASKLTDVPLYREEFKNNFFEILSNHVEKPFDTSAFSLYYKGNYPERKNNSRIKLLPFIQEIPFIYSDSLITTLLSDTLKREIGLMSWRALRKKSEVLFGSEIFPVYQKMMVDSDNLLAEQLLLMCADKQFGVLNSNKIITYAKDSIFQDLPDELLWRDGSGLSRYNMFTPRTIVRLLEKLQQELPEEKLLSLFPSGGEAGTIKDWYGGKNEPYVFAKTGTMTGKHCLSGYVKTRSGKTLIFSFMHNNYKGSSQPLKEEMQRVLENIYDQY